MTRTAGLLLAILLGVSCGAIGSWAQPRYETLGLRYIFPSAHGAGELISNGATPVASLSWGVDVPVGTILWSDQGACPAGWAEYTALRGRYAVGLVSGGTNAAGVGVDLTNLENKIGGVHTHTSTTTVVFSDPNHAHNSITDPGHLHGGVPARSISNATSGVDGSTAGNNINTSTNATGITINSTAAAAMGVSVALTPTISNTASPNDIAGTNAPYVQLIACQKS